jgi:hypothetical protein
METRANFLINYATRHGPVSVRGLYYQAEIARLPGITKDDRDYDKIQRQVLLLRRQGRLSYEAIADATRWMRKPRSHNGIEDALRDTAALYRKSLWHTAPTYVEIWVEKDAIAGTIYPVTSAYDVPLMVARGFSSETFCFEAVQQRTSRKPYHVYYLGDFDRAGVSAGKSLSEKLHRFAAARGIPVIFETIGVTLDQIVRMGLPTRPPKRKTPADRKWPYDFACELDAMPADELRAIVEGRIQQHLPEHQFISLKAAEESEREMLRFLVQSRGASA